MNVIKVKRTSPDAVLPKKAYTSDVGYDLTAIGVHSRLPCGTILYNTGLSVSPPFGFYLEVLPRSSLSKTGFVLSNSVGIIDPSYRGDILIALSPLRDNTPEIPLPFTKCQLILRRQEFGEILEVSDLNSTERGSGGFGSTDKN